MCRLTTALPTGTGTACGQTAAADLTPRPLSLRVNYSWTFLGNIVYAGCQWGMLMALAKLGSPELVGQFALGLAIAAPIMAFSMLALRAVQATDAKQEYVFGDYLSLRLLTTILAMAAIACIAPAVADRWDTMLVVLAAGLATVPESISDVLYGLLQQRERMDRIAKSMLLKGPLTLTSMAVTFFVTRSVCCAIAAIGLSRVLVLLCYDLPSGMWVVSKPRADATVHSQKSERIAPRWCRATMAKLAWLTLPLGVTVMLMSLIGNIPRYFVEHYLGTRELGVFAALAYLMLVGTTLVGALGQSASPRLAQYYATGRIFAYRQLLYKLLVMGTLLGVMAVLIAVFAGPRLLTMLYAAEYAEKNIVLVWLMAAASVSYVASFLGYGITAARYFKIQIVMNGLTAGTAMTACWILVPRHGLCGAAAATLAASLVQLATASVIVFHAMQQGGKERPTWAPSIAS